MKINIYSPEFGLEKGGIQTWAFYVKKLFDLKSDTVSVFAYRENGVLDTLKGLFSTPEVAVLMSWKMAFLSWSSIVNSQVKVICFIHGNEILGLNYFQRKVLNFLFGKNVIFVANSRAIADLFESETKLKVNSIVYPFMDVVDDSYTLKSDDFTQELNLVTVSRLVPRKNILNVIDAVDQLNNEGFDVRYTIGGSGPELERITERVSSAIFKDKIQVVGKISETEKDDLYAVSDVFILPSIFDVKDNSIEGYGIVYIEANAYGLPCICGNTGGVTEAVQHEVTGLHCNGSIEDIKAAILKIMNFKFDRQLIREHVERHDFRQQDDFYNLIVSDR